MSETTARAADGGPSGVSFTPDRTRILAIRTWSDIMSNSYVKIYVSNSLGYNISRVWLAHTTSETTWTECWMATSLKSGDSTLPLNWQAALVPRSNDYFTVMWTDDANNLFGSPLLFKAECDIGEGNINIQLEGGSTKKVVVLQGTNVRGSAAISQYGFAPQSSSAQR